MIKLITAALSRRADQINRKSAGHIKKRSTVSSGTTAPISAEESSSNYTTESVILPVEADVLPRRKKAKINEEEFLSNLGED